MIGTENGRRKYGESKRQILKAIEEKRLVLFVGAGTSLGAGMPSWRDAVQQIAFRLGMHSNSIEGNYLRIPQYYYNARGKKEYTQLAREIFKYDARLNTKPIHRKL